MHTDPAMAIVHAAEEAGIDVLVVGNAGMAGRREFLLGNVPNRISHNARCTVIIVNTVSPNGPATPVSAPPSGVQIMPAHEEPEVDEDAHLMGRAARIGSVLGKHGLKELFTPRGPRRRGEPPPAGAASPRRAGGARPDLREARADPLHPPRSSSASVHRGARDAPGPRPPLTEEQVVTVMEQELGVPWEDVFESIDPEPMAAGTIAQVHRATLTDGERVVVKVQRPTARQDIMQDLGLLELFAKKTESRPAFRR
jgi:hypothetical protein